LKKLPSLTLLYLAALALLVMPVQAMADFDPGHAAFQLEYNDTPVKHQIMSFSVMPSSSVKLSIPERDRDGGVITAEASAGRLEAKEDWGWEWQAPSKPGTHAIELKREDGANIRLNLFVLVPADRVSSNGYLDGYRIGKYPSTPLRGNPIYRQPEGFIRVDRSMRNIKVSPHFTLGQFLCKQQPDHWPKYLLLRTDLLIKLEVILAEVNHRGIRTDSFTVMSGYRTPWYNEAIGNARYSRHVWGGAADIFIDTNRNGRMDDLTSDGKSDIKDAQLLLDIIDEMFKTPRHQRLIGGLGLYGPRPHRGPFVHVDVRGENAYWTLP